MTSTKLKSMELVFSFGKPVDETTADGRVVKTTVVLEGEDKWVTEQTAQKAGEKNVRVVRRFTDEGIEVEMICEDVVSKQFFARQ